MAKLNPRERAIKEYQKAQYSYNRKRNRLIGNKDIPYDMWYTPQKTWQELSKDAKLTTWDIKRNTKILQNMNKRGAEKIIKYHGNMMPKGLKENTRLAIKHINYQKSKINKKIKTNIPKEQPQKIPKSDRFNNLEFYMKTINKAKGNYQSNYGENYQKNYIKAIRDNFSSADNMGILYSLVSTIDSSVMINLSLAIDGLYIKDMYPAKGQQNDICNLLINRWRKALGKKEINFEEELDNG